jgi:Flp pilus assembly protein TadG
MTCRLQRERANRRRQMPSVLRAKARGSSLVEQSFVIVFLLTMMLGIIDFGRALYTYHFVSNVAREATRWASVRSSSCKPGGWLPGCPASGNTIRTTFKANMATMGLDPSKVTFTTTYAAPPGVAVTSCTAIGNHPGCMVHVDVTYTFAFFFAPFIAAPPISMTSGSEMLITQ